MARFLLLWEMDTTKLPDDPKERIAAWTMSMNMVKSELKSGKLKDWGMFPGELAGYGIREGTEVDIAIATGRYGPAIKYKTHPVLSVSQTDEVLKALSQA